MIRFCLVALIITTALITVKSQEPVRPVKFKDFVFDDVSIRKNLIYNEYPATSIKATYYHFDFYEPAADSTPLRPLIIWLHGGGFRFGKKTSGGLPVWCKTFAKRGYACASLNYRLSKKHPLRHFEDMLEGCADAMEDVRQGINFFKQHAREFRIDSSRIILGGNSAGGMIALQSVYSSAADIAKLIHRGDSVDADAGPYNPQQVAAVINYWGALFNPEWLRHGRVPIVSAHGKKDRVVPYDNRRPPVYGSMAIHRKADSLGIPNAVKIFDGYAHELQKHFNPLFAGRGAKKRWLQAGQFAAEFLYEQLFR